MKKSVEPPPISRFLTFCSLSGNQISNIGACELARALQVNHSLQELEWVQLFMSLYFFRSVHGMCWNNRESLQMAPETYIWLFFMIWWEITAHIHLWRYIFDLFYYIWVLMTSYLIFCSLGSNQISARGAHALVAALQVNQSLQKLKWVQPFCPTSQAVCCDCGLVLLQPWV